MRLTIQYKIALLITFIVAVLLSGIYFYLKDTLTDHVIAETRQQLRQDIDLARSYLKAEFPRNPGVENIDPLIDRIGRDLNLRATYVMADGQVLGDSFVEQKEISLMDNHLYRPEIQTALNEGIGYSRRHSNTLLEEYLYVAADLEAGSRRGVLRLSVPVSSIDVFPAHLRHVLVVYLVVALALAVIFGFVASGFIARPIREISRTAKRIADGDFRRTNQLKTNDEIEDLSESINFMSDQIKSRIEDERASKSRLEAVFLSMFEGVMIVDNAGDIVLINQTLREIFHVDQNPLGRKPLEALRNVQIQEITDTLLTKESGVESRELTTFLPEEKVLLIHGTPVLRESEVDGAVLVFHDITDLRKLEKVRQDFVANVSHELRTPIASIKGYAETLLEGALQDKKHAREFIEIIHSDSERLAKLINELLDLSQIESGKMKMKFNRCSVADIIGRMTASWKRKAQEKSVEITAHIPGNLPDIRADETSIAQVIMNLLENAIKYNKENGTVNITAREEGEDIVLDVTDTGIGIPEKDLPRIFERFYRVDKARSRQLGGTGLGLSIVKHMVQAHNGNVYVKSVLGRGSTFTITLPKA